VPSQTAQDGRRAVEGGCNAETGPFPRQKGRLSPGKIACHKPFIVERKVSVHPMPRLKNVVALEARPKAADLEALEWLLTGALEEIGRSQETARALAAALLKEARSARPYEPVPGEMRIAGKVLARFFAD
jgi:hypothetical protein